MADEPKHIHLPDHIAEKVIRALQELSFYLHEKTDASHILLDIKHISDAAARASSTLIAGGGGGFKLNLNDKREQARKELAESDAEKLAQEAIDRALNQAKNKGDKDA